MRRHTGRLGSVTLGRKIQGYFCRGQEKPHFPCLKSLPSPWKHILSWAFRAPPLVRTQHNILKANRKKLSCWDAKIACSQIQQSHLFYFRSPRTTLPVCRNKDHLSHCNLFVYMSIFQLNYKFIEGWWSIQTGLNWRNHIHIHLIKLHSWFIWPRMPEAAGQPPKTRSRGNCS